MQLFPRPKSRIRQGLILSLTLKSGQTSGHIAIWNLNERKMAGQMRDAHCGAITGMSCFPSEPILVTSSPDNTIKQVSSFFSSNCNV